MSSEEIFDGEGCTTYTTVNTTAVTNPRTPPAHPAEKPWCQHSHYEGYGLFRVPGCKGHTPFVLSCGRPSEAVWYGWLAQCSECFDLYSSPFTLLCRVCWKESMTTQYPSWRWAAREDRRLFKKMLDSVGNRGTLTV